MDLSVVIVSWNSRDALRNCLTSLYEEAGDVGFEVFVVDNASVDGSAEMVESAFPGVELTRNLENAGFATANNQAIRLARGRYVWLLNPDTIVLDGAPAKMVRFLDDHPDVGALGCKILTPRGGVDVRCAQRSPTLRSEFFAKTKLAVRFPRISLLESHVMAHEDHDDSRDVDALSGACMLVRRRAIAEAGLLDEDFFMYWEDVEWCHRIRQAGWRVFYHAGAEIVHLGAQSTNLVRNEMGIEGFKSLNLLFRKRYGPAYAWGHRALTVLLATAKQLVFLALFLASRDAASRRRYRHKVRLHGRVRRWAVTGQPR